MQTMMNYQRLTVFQPITKLVRKLRLILICSTSLLLMACANTAPYGNYLPSKDCGDPKMLAYDASVHLSAMYLPAKVKIIFTHKEEDEFGRELIKNLRLQGYAVQEFIKDNQDKITPKTNPASNKQSNQCYARVHPQAKPSPCDKPELFIELGYVLDQIRGDNLYRVTLAVDSTTISRPYVVEDGKFIAAGDWIRRQNPSLAKM